jgi:hypothetical protein
MCGGSSGASMAAAVKAAATLKVSAVDTNILKSLLHSTGTRDLITRVFSLGRSVW